MWEQLTPAIVEFIETILGLISFFVVLWIFTWFMVRTP